MRIVDLLIKNKKLTKKIKNINFHFNLLTCDLEYFKTRIPELNGKSNAEILDYIIEVFNKCDSSSKDYDSKLDEQMTRIGLKTDVFYGTRVHNKKDLGLKTDVFYGTIVHNKMENSFADEENENQLTSIYDDYIDSMSNGR